MGSKRFEKIEKLKEKWKKDKNEVETERPEVSPEWNIWRMKRKEDTLSENLENLENLITAETEKENIIKLNPTITSTKFVNRCVSLSKVKIC